MSVKAWLVRKLRGPQDRKERILQKVMSAVRSWNLPPGDYLEFGVYEGRSFIQAYKWAERNGLDSMHFYAFDSFAGLPTMVDEEAVHGLFEEGQYACRETVFRDNLRKAGVDERRVTVVPGFYDRALDEDLKWRLHLRRAAVVFVDCDLYGSAASALDFVGGYLTTGSILIFDDWFAFGADPEAGEMRAAREWLERNPHIRLIEYHKFGISGVSFVVQVTGEDSEPQAGD